jgi:hypothetical protein
MTSIHEIKQVLPVNTPHGKGLALFIIDYGLHANTIWIVSLFESGEVKHYDSRDIRVERNWTVEFNLNDEKPNK